MKSAFGLFLSVSILTLAAINGASAAPTPPPAASAPQTQPAKPASKPALPEKIEKVERDPVRILFDEIDRLRAEIVTLRHQLAAVKLLAAQAERERDEIKQFLADHHEFGADFAQYQAVKEAAEREAKRREAEAARERREADKAVKAERRRAALAEKAQRDAQAAQVARYRRSGFTPLGLDVYSSKMAFFYEAKDTERTRVDYDPLIGTYLRPLPVGSEIDYSQMTISGSVLNASDEVRNLGIAITFFDDNGNQVGHETVQINNARPDVPYPFTSKIDMALNRAFDSSSTYVLYADPVDEDEPPAP